MTERRSSILYSFPVQLLLTHFKRNQLMILGWLVLLAMVTGNFGKYLGIPYLFLDPEYMDRVNFTSFFIMGLTTAGYAAAFNITSYITEGHRFSFIGALPRPFTKFALNNSILPMVFISVYIFQMVAFQVSNANIGILDLAVNISGFLFGLLSLTALLYTYFFFTQKDIFRYVVCRLDARLKKTVPITKASALRKLDIARKKQERVDNYLDYDFSIKKVGTEKEFYDKQLIVQVFDQNHFNLVVIELTLFLFILLLGIFKDVPAFQIPAAATFMIFLTVFVMIAGAFGYWFGGWSGTAALILFLVMNYLIGIEFFSRRFEAFGLSNKDVPVKYSRQNLVLWSDSVAIKDDKSLTLQQLNNWRAKFKEPPTMVLLCTSGGGKRSTLWSFAALQEADRQTNGQLINHSVLITGASGGLIGASYYRELWYRKNEGQPVDPYAGSYLQDISSDNLNPLIFSLLANDIFSGSRTFKYGGFSYRKDRAFTFEQQLNKITGDLMDKPLGEYRAPELSGKIPMIVLAPTIVNDGRKLYIASRPVSFFPGSSSVFESYDGNKIAGVDFHRMFEGRQPDSLRFLSALRMSATFPYITPNTTLPSDPPLLIMDAGISDNFGVSDAVRFLFVFRDWIQQNTSGALVLSIRDSPKIRETKKLSGQSIVDQITQPISSVYNNFENFQDINSDFLMTQSPTWLKVPVYRVDLEYEASDYVSILGKMDSIRQNSARASLSWRLTNREKRGIIANLKSAKNQKALEKIRTLVGSGSISIEKK
ncbi:MAG: patatin-like phospholipase family protein [Bacteroidetes bacterium]|nr:patatin-like phospholipase family protein [Bacteroidota bacterium]